MIKDALNIEQLHVQIKDLHILKDFSLNLDQGDILCLLGPSGCGKTTALKAIAGLIPSINGRIKLFEKVIQNKNSRINVSPEKREMGFIFQDYALFPHLTVYENVAFSLKGQSKSDIEKKVHGNLKLVQLNGLENRYPHQLSGGQQQRTAVARALSSQPKLLLMDEPFSNVDNQVKLQMMAELRKLLKANNITCIFVTHSKQEAFSFADKTAVLNNGCIEQVDVTKNILEYPTNVFVAKFMEAGNIVASINLSENLFSDVNSLSNGQYLLKENGFKVTSEKDSIGVEAQVLDCLYIGYRYRIKALLSNSNIQLQIETPDSIKVGSRISLQYIHQPVHIPD
jgi:iron(III) transport system ATP-binding protein